MFESIFNNPPPSKGLSRMYFSIVENMNEGVFVVDEYDQITYTNKSFCKMLNTDKGYLNGKNIIDLVVSDEKINYQNNQRLHKKFIEEKFETELKFGPTNVVTSISPKILSKENGNYDGYFGIVTNITSNTNINTSLSISDDILEQIGTLFIVGNVNGDILYCAPSVTKILGFDSGKMLLKGWYQHTFKNEQEAISQKKKFIDIANGKYSESDSHYERKVKCVDGTEKWILWKDTKGPVGLFLSVGHDITDRKKTEQKLNESKNALRKKNKELDTFVYKASHDLKGPLASIIGLTNLAQKSPNSEAQTYFSMIKKSTEKLNTILDDLLRISRITHGTVNNQKIDLTETVTEVFDSLKHKTGASSIRFTTDIKDNIIVTDYNYLSSILQNLLSNAIKYHKTASENRFIRVSSWSDNRQHYLEIEDNGQGIPREFQDKIFDMFYRAHDNTEGTGLGLYIVKTTVNKLKGKISIQSSPKIGTKIKLQLPVI